MNILLIEDDLEICEMLSGCLQTENYQVTEAHDGAEACRIFERETFDLVLLDLMIPKKSGMEVLQSIRQTSVVPVIILSARDSESDKVLGLSLGADDYVTKPFSVAEVLARVRTNIRRATQYSALPQQNEEEILTAGSLVMNLSNLTVTKSGLPVDLTAKEFEILKLLMKHPKKIYTKEQLYSLVWKDAYYGDENAVNVHISRLRAKLEDDSRNPRCILTVWGIGYKLGELS